MPKYTSPPPLTDFGNVNTSEGGIDPNWANSAPGQDFLSRLQYYMPDAHYAQSDAGMSLLNGNGGGILSGDVTKLPKNPMGNYGWGGVNDLGGKYGADQHNSYNNEYASRELVNPRAIVNDPTYGRVTPNQNIKQPLGLADRIGPLIVGGAIGLGGLGGAGGFLSKLPSMMTKFPQLMNQASSMFSKPNIGWMGQLAQYIARRRQQQYRGPYG